MMNRTCSNRRPLALLIAVGTTGLLPAIAWSQTWDGGGANNNWTDVANWNPNAVPVNNGTANVTLAGSIRLSPLVNIGYDVNSLTIAAGAGSFNLGGSGPLTLRAGGIANLAVTAQAIRAHGPAQPVTDSRSSR